MLTQEEFRRYERQLLIPEIGREGQERLHSAGVLVAGLGGLGSTSSYQLAAAGVGFLRIVDRDKVELSNLNRQILHRTEDLGKTKGESASEKLSGLNPHCRIEAVFCEINHDNVRDLLAGCDIILDATDNIHTRRLLNKTSVETGIPFVYGGVNGFEGMAATFIPGKTPCFECLFSHCWPDTAPNPAFAPLVGLVGSIQALEILKYLLGMEEELLAGRLLKIYGGRISFREIRVERNTRCPVCEAR